MSPRLVYSAVRCSHASCSSFGHGHRLRKVAPARLPLLVRSASRQRFSAACLVRRDGHAPPYAKYGMPTKRQGQDGSAVAPRKHVAYIALGSNLGDRISMIERACREMDARGIRVLRTSSLWETEPMYVLDQDLFLNGACEVETALSPMQLLDALQDIESTMGRRKVVEKGPRNIDLDILLYDDVRVSHERLRVPHPGIAEREFVLRPLVELVPNKAIDAARPWRLAQDDLNDLAVTSPLTTVTPLGPSHPCLHLQALKADRRTLIMAILNMTPDSFSDGGLHSSADVDVDVMRQTVRSCLAAGASILDIGGQSTAPRAPQVTAEEETSRIVPVIELIRSMPEADGAVISVDTYRPSVARAAVAAGAHMVNDISAGGLEESMLSTVAQLGATVCLMHSRGTPATMSQLNDYPPLADGGNGIITAIANELLGRVAAAEAAGIRRWRIVLDPGLGFAKVGAQNLQVLRHLEELRDWPGLRGLPWLVGSSRKSFIGHVTGVQEPRDRVWGTAATVAAAIRGGVDIVRVHDVKEMAQVAAMSDAIWRY